MMAKRWWNGKLVPPVCMASYKSTVADYVTQELDIWDGVRGFAVGGRGVEAQLSTCVIEIIALQMALV